VLKDFGASGEERPAREYGVGDIDEESGGPGAGIVDGRLVVPDADEVAGHAAERAVEVEEKLHGATVVQAEQPRGTQGSDQGGEDDGAEDEEVGAQGDPAPGGRFFLGIERRLHGVRIAGGAGDGICGI